MMKMLDGSFMMIIIAFNITLMELGWHQADWIGGTLTPKADCGSRLPLWNRHQSQQQTIVVSYFIFNLLKPRVRYLRNQKCIHRRSSQWMTQKNVSSVNYVIFRDGWTLRAQMRLRQHAGGMNLKPS
ncbi:hypothetical protein PF011_g18076 [Phytophthora fragariae]|uniref:Secreted protein n=1 Tax=Phytophthora fragariae TaxID=53985 RepID=A0A6A3JA27_9STRA|nr:hypothetical protein PF011_g18076 [Phytophthora fragariae]